MELGGGAKMLQRIFCMRHLAVAQNAHGSFEHGVQSFHEHVSLATKVRIEGLLGDSRRGCDPGCRRPLHPVLTHHLDGRFDDALLPLSTSHPPEGLALGSYRF